MKELLKLVSSCKSCPQMKIGPVFDSVYILYTLAVLLCALMANHTARQCYAAHIYGASAPVSYLPHPHHLSPHSYSQIIEVYYSFLRTGMLYTLRIWSRLPTVLTVVQAWTRNSCIPALIWCCWQLSCSITLLCVLTVHGKFSVVYKFLLAYLLTLGVSHVMRSINVRYLLTYLLKSLPTSDVVKATILRPRPQPRRPKVISPEAKAVRAHGVVSRAEIKIRSTSDHLIG